MFRPRPRDLWADSEDEETTSNNNSPEIEVIQIDSSPERMPNTIVLSTQSNELPFLPPPPMPSAPPPPPPSSPPPPLPSTSSLAAIQSQIMAPYVPRTLQQNSRRHSILPAFPSESHEDRPPLLLANVPIHKLNQEQLARRQKGVYPLGYTLAKTNLNVPSNFRSTYQPFIRSLACQYNVDESIVEYNLHRFNECYRLFIEDSVRIHQYTLEELELTEKQKKYAIEFYLQMDVDLFFMKTCSFRNAIPRSTNEGLFCIDEPDSRYGLSACNSCELCVPPYNTAHRQQPMMRFGPSQKFRFVNGYQSILNCPATCQTQNIIYVMTCPCGEFEYIGQTSQRLGDRLHYHRQHLNRIIHEFLIGEKNVALTRTGEKDFGTLVKDRMLLYRHAARCPSVIQIFLNFNPIYSCFIPITPSQATRHSRNYVLPSTLVSLDLINPTSIASKDRRDIPATENTRSDETVRSCMRHIPPLPTGYTYSICQRAQQFQYFKDKLDITKKQDQVVDLFNATIIAVLPGDASKYLRNFVEALFITHTEAKLNTAGQLLRTANNNNDENDNNTNIRSSRSQIIDRGEWCRNITFRN